MSCHGDGDDATSSEFFGLRGRRVLSLPNREREGGQPSSRVPESLTGDLGLPRLKFGTGPSLIRRHPYTKREEFGVFSRSRFPFCEGGSIPPCLNNPCLLRKLWTLDEDCGGFIYPYCRSRVVYHGPRCFVHLYDDRVSPLRRDVDVGGLGWTVLVSLCLLDSVGHESMDG